MSAALLDHLWQSTLFAICAWMLTWVLRKNGAHLRHVVWSVASLKFLIPFSWLALLGQAMQPHVGLEDAHVLAAAGKVHTVLGAPGLAIAVEPAPVFWRIATVIWLIGLLVFLGRWFIRWRRIREILHEAVPIAMAAPVPVRMSAELREPGVIGIVRPVLLLPTGITTRLTPPQLEAIVRHELCHVRRHDNLASAIHMLIEALYWFHPFVWWIGARMLEERERACDESVVQSGSDRRVYAEGILRVCQSYLASDLACVAGVSGADLKLRLEAIMTREVKALGMGKRFALGALALAAISVPVMVGLASPAQAAQAAAAVQPAAKPVGKIELLAGKRVKLQYQDVDVRALIQAMGDAGGVNILVSDKVSGTVTVKLVEMPWDQAFAIILSSKGLVKREQDGIVFVEPASA